MGYDAFISYSHEGDRDLAEALQEGLARFAKPWYRRRALNVFRDSTGLSANPGLWSAITDVMEDSKFFVVLCSPASASSPWVGREIEHWVATKPTERILPVLTAGELLWDESAGRFDPARSTAAHPALLEVFAEEPLYVDLSGAAAEGYLSLRNPGFQDKVADLAAPMHGIAKDELVGEDVRQHRRTLRFAWGAALAMLALTIATAIGATVAVSNAELAKRRAEEKVRIEGQLNQKKAELVAVNATLRRRQDVLASTQSQLETANASTESAQALATQSQSEAAANARLAALQQVAARVAEQDATTQRGEVGRLQGLAAVSVRAQTSAEQARRVADRARLDADRDRSVAEQARSVAEGKTLDALAAERRAVIRTNEADALNRATRLASDAQSPDRVNSALDLSLLLAVESSLVVPAPDPPLVGANAFAPQASALSSVVGATGGLQGFLHFPEGEEPAALGQVSVSPDGRFVAAVETSPEIERGTATARLYVWNGPDPTTVDAVTVSNQLQCVSDLQWAVSGVLVTVDHLGGCLNPYRIYTDPDTGFEYVGTRVALWGFEGTPLEWAVVLPGEDRFGYSLFGRSPVEISPDGQFISIAYDSAERRPEGEPIIFSVLLDTTTILQPASTPPRFHLQVHAMQPAGLLGQKTFSPDGRFAIGLDEVSDAMALWDLQTWIPPSEDDGCQLSDSGCFLRINPTDAAGAPDDDIGAHLAFAPRGSQGPGSGNTTFVATSRDLGTIKFFDAATGHEIGGTRRDVEELEGLAFNGDVAAVVVGSEGAVRLIHLNPDDPDQTIPVVTPAPGCTFYPNFGDGGKLLFLQRLCPPGDEGAGASAPSTLVVNVNTGRFLREIPGQVSFSSTDDRYVVAQRQPNASTEGADVSVLFGFEIWDFSRGPTGDLVDSSTKALAFVSPDGSTVAAIRPSFAGSSNGRAASIWKLGAGGVEQETLPGSVGVQALGFGPGNTLVGVGTLGDPRDPAHRVNHGIVWDTAAPPEPGNLDLEGLRKRACTLAGRNLTQSEFDFYEIGGAYRPTCG